MLAPVQQVVDAVLEELAGGLRAPLKEELQASDVSIASSCLQAAGSFVDAASLEEICNCGLQSCSCFLFRSWV